MTGIHNREVRLIPGTQFVVDGYDFFIQVDIFLTIFFILNATLK